ncbi:MAG: pseudouridine-5'-phosphate glycosidase [Ferruginibacter sp.]
MNSEFLKIDPEVLSALQNGKPIVALESTIISHGMPWPKNVETALKVEAAVREQGAIPATIAIRDGKCLVGLNAAELDFFGKEKNVWKVSIRDMPYVLSQKLPGATTVAATMRIASMAGIKIFATGGIGGVHRGAAESMDISADLTEMAQTDVAVVSAGVKSILDIGLTLEYLETKGIPVVTFGQNEFPSFYSGKSNFNSPLRLDSAADIANMLKVKWNIGLKGTVLIANPVPGNEQVSPDVIEQHIQQALKDADKQQIKGKEITPFLLKHIAEHTKGESLEANIALVLNNARLAANIAVALK